MTHRRPPIPIPPPESSRPDYGPLLALLNHAQLDFVIVGPTAARARGVDTTGLSLPHEIDLTPAPTDSNLATLAQAFAGDTLRLRAPDDQALPITLSPELIRAIPALPLTTQFGDVNVLLHPVGAPTDYDELRDEASTVELDTVPTLVPTIEALLRGLAGGAHQPHRELLARLRQLAHRSHLDPVPAVQPPLTEAERRNDLEHAIIQAIERLGYPASIRDVIFAMNSYWRPRYKQVKIAAESLTDRGQLVRDKDGTAHRYRLNTCADDQIAHDVASLLSKATDVEGTVAKALRLTAQDKGPAPA